MPNVIGGPIPGYVKNQIVKRQSIKGSGTSSNRTPQQIAALNSPTAWVKLASGVSVDGNRLQKNSLPSSYSGIGLAKNHVLFGGFSSLNGNKLSQRDTFQEIYGSGDNQFGLVPMPGIESIDVKHLNNGSIRSAEVKIKAYNKTQFSILDILYMRLGYVMLLEWGNSNYINNSGGYENMGPTIIESGFFTDAFSKKSPTEVLIDISKKRQSTSGNYDAIYGRISNFDWSFSQDGSYDITLKLISIGDIIESLRVDVTPSKKWIDFINEYQEKLAPEPEPTEVTPPESTETTESTPPQELDENQKSEQEKEASPVKNRLLAHLFVQKLYHKQATTPPSTETETDDTSETSDNSTNNHLIYYKIGTDEIGIGDFITPTGSLVITQTTTQGGFLGFFEEEVTEITAQINTEPTNQTKFDVVYFEYTNGDAPDPPIPDDLGYYIRFGYLLDYIQNYIIPKVDKGKGDKNPPLINLSFKGGNIMYYFPDQISLDPRVCIVNSTLGSLSLFPLLFDWTREKEQRIGAYTPNIYISFSTIQQSMETNTDEDGKVNLFAFLSSICSALNVALGGVNNLQPIIDEDSNTIRIIDSSYIPSLRKDYSLLLYGYKGDESTIVRNFDLKTGITSDYAYLITVGSTNKGYAKGSENTMFSKWNQGIIDRYKQELTTATTTSPESDAAENYRNNFYAKGKLALGYKYNGDAIAPELDNNSIDKNISIASEFYKYAQSKVHQKYKNYASPSQGFMSLSLGLTLDGIAGLRIGDAINVDTRIFPVNYPTTLRFIIKSISHKLSGQDWETVLDTVVVTENYKPDGSPVIPFSTLKAEVQALSNLKSVTLDKTTGNINVPSWYTDWKTAFNTPPSVTPTLGAGGPAIIIGDSQSPSIAQFTTKAKLLGDGKTEGASTLWQVGLTTPGLIGFLKTYPTDPSVNYVVINIGTNDGYNPGTPITDLVNEVKKHFPSAALLAVQGSWNWGLLKNITPSQVSAFYAKFSALGVTILNPPIGDINFQVAHPDASNTPSFKEIGKSIDAAIGG